jgi:hypothetical protein
MAIANTLQLFLNLDISKNPNSTLNRLKIKLDIIQAIINKIENERRY